MFDFPAKLSRPNQGFTGEESKEGMGENSRTIWCDPQLNNKSMMILIQADEDVRVGDFIELPYSTTIVKS